MRGTQFLQLVTMLREDVGRSPDVSVGVSDVPSLKQRINEAYEFLYADYDWPHLRVFYPVTQLNYQQQYYDFPVVGTFQLDYERVERVVVWYNGRPVPVERGIAHEDYFSFDSQATPPETSAPVLKWDVRFTGTKEQCEVWPVPSDSSQTLQFVGFKKFVRLVNDGDTCLLDDNMVVLRASAEILARQSSKDAPMRATEARDYYELIKRRTKGAARTRRLGQGNPGLNRQSGPPHFYVTVR
jgi:hypothetical protein